MPCQIEGAIMKRILCAAVALIVVAATARAQDPRATFTSGTASAARGQRAYGVLRVPAASDPGTDIAVVVINGASPAPGRAIVSGAHGTEYVSIMPVESLIVVVDRLLLSG